MSEQWYYSKDDQKYGPVNASKLKEIAASGQLRPTDLLWREGMKQWAKAGTVRGLFPDALHQSPLPISPKKSDESPPLHSSSAALPPIVNTAIDSASLKYKVPSSQTAIFHIRYLSSEADHIKFLQGKGEVRLEGTMLIFSGKLPFANPFKKPKPLTIPITDIGNITANGTRIKLQYRKEEKVKNFLFTTQTKEDAEAILAALPTQIFKEVQQNKDEQKAGKIIGGILGGIVLLMILYLW